MARTPSVFEKVWPTVLLSPIAVANHIITLPTTRNLHTKQIITLRLNSDAEEFEIKKVLNDTQIQVGKKNAPINSLENPVKFNGGSLEMHEQKRNEIGSEYVIRAVYDEEPAVALRTLLVTEFGEKVGFSLDNSGNARLKVDAEVIKFNEIQVERNFTNEPNLAVVKYFSGETEVKRLELSYDENGDLIKVKKVEP
jgi:hypothetical protein